MEAQVGVIEFDENDIPLEYSIYLDITASELNQLKGIRGTVKMIETSRCGVTVFSDKVSDSILMSLVNTIINVTEGSQNEP